VRIESGAVEGAAPRRRSRLGNPLSWRIADRCVAIALLMTGAATLVLIADVIADGWPFLPYRASDAPRLIAVQALAVALWVAVAVASRVAQSRDAAGTGLSIVTVGLFVITLAGFTLLIGPFASPGWIAYLGGAVIGYVMFPRWLSLSGTALYAILVVGGAALFGAGVSPGIAPRSLYEGLDFHTVARRATAALTLFALTFTVIAWIVERWRDRESRYQRLASTDPLTGLTNRRRFLEVASQELARARRYGSSVALVLVDLDHFKRINDVHGHLIGDQALVHSARVLAASVRDVDVIARHGGEEFAILLPMTDARGALEVAERCTRRLADSPLVVDGIAPIRVTASMGVAACAGASCGDVDDMLRAADAAMYRAKEHGRDRVELAVW